MGGRAIASATGRIVRRLFSIILLGLPIACHAEAEHVTISIIDRGRPAAFDSCGIEGRIRHLRVRDSIAAVVGEARPGEVCVFDLRHGQPLKSPALRAEISVQGTGFVGNRLWISDALTRRVLFFSLSTGEFAYAVEVPTLGPRFQPVVLDISDRGEMIVLHWTASAGGDSISAIISRLREVTEYEVVDSLLVLTPTVVIRGSERSEMLQVGTPWIRADLLSELSTDGVVLVRQMPLAGNETTVETIGYSSRSRQRAVDTLEPSLLSPESTAKWVDSLFSDSVVNLVGGRQRVKEAVIRAVRPPVPLPAFGRLIALTRNRLLFQRNWPNADQWELRTGDASVLGTVAIGDNRALYVASGESVWGIEYGLRGKERLFELRFQGHAFSEAKVDGAPSTGREQAP